MKLVAGADTASALQVFRAEWENLIRLQMTEILVSRAETLAWITVFAVTTLFIWHRQSFGRICCASR